MHLCTFLCVWVYISVCWCVHVHVHVSLVYNTSISCIYVYMSVCVNEYKCGYMCMHFIKITLTFICRIQYTAQFLIQYNCNITAAEHFIYADERIHVILSILFNCFISHGYLPSEFMKTAIVPIIKNKTGDTSDKNNYRVSLMHPKPLTELVIGLFLRN